MNDLAAARRLARRWSTEDANHRREIQTWMEAVQRLIAEVEYAKSETQCTVASWSTVADEAKKEADEAKALSWSAGAARATTAQEQALERAARIAYAEADRCDKYSLPGQAAVRIGDAIRALKKGESS